jgi:hypothetical protein
MAYVIFVNEAPADGIYWFRTPVAAVGIPDPHPPPTEGLLWPRFDILEGD